VLHNNASHLVYLKEGQLQGVVQEMSEMVVDEAVIRTLQVEESPTEFIQSDCCEQLLKVLNLQTFFANEALC